MNHIASLLAGFAGFFVGMLLWVQFTRWLGLLFVSGSRHGGDFLGEPKRRLIWAIPFLGLLHPAPWLLAAAAYLGYRAFHGDLAAGWNWFFGGLLLAFTFMLATAASAILRWRRRVER